MRAVRRQQTIRINQGYRIDSRSEALAVAGRAVGGTAHLAWRWRTELGLLAAVLLVRLAAGGHLSGGTSWTVTLSTVAAVVAWPRSRRLVAGRLAAASTRRRLLDCMRETRVATSAGRLPLVLRSRSSAAGERLVFGLFPGQSAELLDARVEELRAAARAMDVTVTRDRTRSDRVAVDVVRRDLLHRALVLPSPLVGVAAALGPRPSVPDLPPSPANTPSEEVPS